MGHPISADTVRKELVKLGFSRQAQSQGGRRLASIPTATPSSSTSTRKSSRRRPQAQPVISVDTKKKELVGNFKNGGSDYRPKGDPRRVNVHDFEDKELGKVVPYGVYDVTANAGFVSVGITSDTAEFAVQSIRCWLERMGRQRYPKARELTITADCGGSNGARVRLWKVELQKLADETGLTLHVHHYPPGTSKWNKIEHRLFCHITQNWRGRPLDGSRRRRRADRRDDDQGRPEGRERTRHPHLREGHQGQRRRDGNASTSPAIRSILNGTTRSSRDNRPNRSGYCSDCP